MRIEAAQRLLSSGGNSQMIILPDSLYAEFSKKLKQLEKTHELTRANESKEKGNSFGMTGNTFRVSYEKGGKYKSFLKDVRGLWQEFNLKHPKTLWRGK